MLHPPLASVLDLAAIFVQAQAGQAAAITALYMRYGPLVQRSCYVRLASVEAAKNCTQAVFIRMWRCIPSFEYRGRHRSSVGCIRLPIMRLLVTCGNGGGPRRYH